MLFPVNNAHRNDSKTFLVNMTNEWAWGHLIDEIALWLIQLTFPT